MANLLFDLDGTLVDSVPSMCAAANTMLARIGRDPVPAETYKNFVGHGMARQIKGVLHHTGGVPESGFDDLLEQFLMVYFDDPLTGTNTYPNVPNTLARLVNDGHRLAVITQKPAEPARRILDWLGLGDMIGVITGGDTLPVLKPDPKMITATLARMPPGPAMMIGDSDVDEKTALAAGISFLFHSAGYGVLDRHSGAATFADWRAVPDLVAQVLAAA